MLSIQVWKDKVSVSKICNSLTKKPKDNLVLINANDKNKAKKRIFNNSYS